VSTHRTSGKTAADSDIVNSPHVQLIADSRTIPGALETALSRLNAKVSMESPARFLGQVTGPSPDLCVILANVKSSAEHLDRILADAEKRGCITLVIPEPPPPKSSLESPDELPRNAPLPTGSAGSAESGQINADELTGRLKALLETHESLKPMREELTRLRQRDVELTACARMLEEELRLAGQLQQDLLPQSSIDTSPLSVFSLYLPAQQVSGDMYNIAHLDDAQLGFSIADATGHGLPAALLTMLCRNAFHGNERNDGADRIIEPDEVLNRLNADLLDSSLTQGQFITGLYAIFDRASHSLRWARGGIPYPILIRPGAPPRQMISQGGLLGAIETQSFEIVTHQLEPADTMLFYTDGLEAILHARGQTLDATSVLDSSWIQNFEAEGPENTLAALRHQVNRLDPGDWPQDDITLLAVQMN